MPVSIPASHISLLEDPVYVILTTLMPDGSPQSSVVWADYEEPYVRINTARGRQKDKNIAANPKVSVLAIRTEEPYFWIEIRGEVVEITEDGAVEHIDKLAKLYENTDSFYGGVAPMEQAGGETRIIYKIKPTRVVTHG